MAKTKIEWTDYTFNPWWGCTKVSPGCKNCYAEAVSNRFQKTNYWGIDAERRFMSMEYWSQPINWNRQAKENGHRQTVLAGSMCDVFEDGGKFIKWRAKLGDLILSTPNLDWLMLSKRELTQRIANDLLWINPDYNSWQIPDNVWLGTSVENQAMADERIPQLLKIPAKIRFLSVEPMLEKIDLSVWLGDMDCGECRIRFFGDRCRNCGKIDQHNPEIGFAENAVRPYENIDLVIVGFESGSNKRPYNPDWARSIRDQCKDAGVPFFMKQMDKVQPIPDDLMIREFPE